MDMPFIYGSRVSISDVHYYKFSTLSIKAPIIDSQNQIALFTVAVIAITVVVALRSTIDYYHHDY